MLTIYGIITGFLIICLIIALFFKTVYSKITISLEDYDYDYKKYKSAIETANDINNVCTFVIITLGILIFIALFVIFIEAKNKKNDIQGDENMITCLNCGNIIPYKCSFCPKCGKAINNGAVPGYCEKCGTVLGKDSAFCRMCGNPIKK